jgi:hypothetical protein
MEMDPPPPPPPPAAAVLTPKSFVSSVRGKDLRYHVVYIHVILYVLFISLISICYFLNQDTNFILFCSAGDH